MPHEHIVETYATERLKTLGVWSSFADADLPYRPAPRARSVLEQLVHQCLSEEAWMAKMLGIASGLAALPARETRAELVRHYAAASGERLRRLRAQPDAWFEAPATFFDVPRTRAWILVRRFTHSAHHRGQLTTYLRLLGRAVYSTYGPTADTGGLAASGGRVVYAWPDEAALLAALDGAGAPAPLPASDGEPAGERPGA